MAIKTIPQMACSHYHFFNPFCPRQTSSQKISTVFFYALGAAVLWVSYRAFRAPTNSVTYQRLDAPLTASPKIKAVLTSRSSKIPILTKPSESKMATLISSAQDIVSLPVSLFMIEKRAEPKAQNNSGGETARGFIHKGDSLLDLMGKAWEVAGKANVTHIEIADHLSKIIKIAKTKQSGEVFNYDWDAKKSVRLQVVFYLKQMDDIIETDIFRPEGPDKGHVASKEEVLIRNPNVQGKCIRWTSVREDYIRNYGFYSVGTALDDLLGIFEIPI